MLLQMLCYDTFLLKSVLRFVGAAVIFCINIHNLMYIYTEVWFFNFQFALKTGDLKNRYNTQ